MSTANTIVAIVSLLGLLISYAFVQQTVTRKREHRKRLLTALKARSRSFKYLLNGFPEGFLSKDLTVLVQRSLADVSEQLSKLEPNDTHHLQNLQVATAQLAETQRKPATTSTVTLSNPQQIKDVKACLEELHKFVVKLETRGVVPRNKSHLYRNQIKLMVMQVSIDSYCLQGNQANQAGKVKLAIHFFDLALNLIVREGKVEAFANKAKKLKQTIAQLKARIGEEETLKPANKAVKEEQKNVTSKWDEFGQDEGTWKKKNVYD